MGEADAPRVLILTGRPPGPELAELLGAARASRLRDGLIARARSWAATAFGDAVSVRESGDVGEALAALTPGRPTILLAPELAAWPPEVGGEALGDLADGCAVSVGALHEGGFYLLAVGDGLPDGVDLTTIDWAGPASMAALLALAGERGFEVGVLRIERALRTPADVRAQLADPMTDAELRGLLG